MKKFRMLAIIMLSTAYFSHAAIQNDGEQEFNKTCIACHTIGKGKLVGPDLKGINETREQEWLIRFIRSSGKMIKEGDPVAVALFEEHNRIQMPDNNKTDAEIISILDYIKRAGSPAADQQAAAGGQGSSGQDTLLTDQGQLQDTTNAGSGAPSTANQPDVADYPIALLQKGKALFYGHETFSTGGSPCIACHNTRDESVIPGGTLSLDLTESYNKLGAAGMNAILTNPPFPVMKSALAGVVLTDEEKESLIAYLHLINKQFADNPIRMSDGLVMLLMSLVLALLVTSLLYIVYLNRKIPSHK